MGALCPFVSVSLLLKESFSKLYGWIPILCIKNRLNFFFLLISKVALYNICMHQISVSCIQQPFLTWPAPADDKSDPSHIQIDISLFVFNYLGYIVVLGLNTQLTSLIGQISYQLLRFQSLYPTTFKFFQNSLTFSMTTLYLLLLLLAFF